jgi:hypothetical protein
MPTTDPQPKPILFETDASGSRQLPAIWAPQAKEFPALVGD